MKSALKTLAFLAMLPCFGLAVNGQEEALPVPQIKTIALSKTGEFVGKVSTAMSSFETATPSEGLFVTLSKNGKAIGSTKTDANGVFKLSGVKAGQYNLVAYGEGALLATGVNVTEYKEGSQSISLFAMPAPYKSAIAILTNYAKTMKLSAAPAANSTRINLVSYSRISPVVFEGDVSGKVNGLGGQAVDGQVILIQGDRVLKNVLVKEGEYTIKDVKAGVYSLLAVSENGFSIVGLEVLKTPSIKTVSFQDESPADMTLADGSAFRFVQQTQTEDEDDDDEGLIIIPGDGGGAIVGGGPGVGGPGFGLGALGLGGLAGLAGLGDGNASPK